ncbi:MAG: DJ-1/PfpI family protein [Candidatus Omnitrophica bacterium]|nr:DJ-1/PfpI family protein [Candidatus Omnitrophota bacterium]
MKKIFFIAAAAAGLFLVIPGGIGRAFAAGPEAKAVFVIAEKDFQDDELAKPLRMLKNSGVGVTIASTTLNQVSGMNGLIVKPHMLLKDVRAADFDAVVFIGGSGSVQYIDDPVAHKLIYDAFVAKKVIGAICLAPMVLARAGVLKYKRATVYPSEAENFKACGVHYTANPVEIYGNIVTANGPAAAGEFGSALLTLLKGGNT